MNPYYSDDSLTLYLGDAAETLRSLPDAAADCIVTSPPYYGLRDYGGGYGEIGRESTPAEYIARLSEVFHEARRALADDGTLWLNLGDSYASHPSWGRGGGSTLDGRGNEAAGIAASADSRLFDRAPKNLLGIPWRVAFALQDDGWMLRSEIVWRKPNAMPESVSDRLSKRHETIFLLTKGPHYFFDLDAIKEPVVSSPDKLDFARDSKEAKHPAGQGAQHRKGRTASAPEMRNPGDVWDISTVPFAGAHFAAFPPELPSRCIRAGCRPGGAVLDPFNGSGTTGLAAAQLGHPYVGIDLNEEYLKLSLDTRLSQPAIL
jgi:site-specific DNA-methyltransferase (cytosine-N4-specific)